MKGNDGKEHKMEDIIRKQTAAAIAELIDGANLAAGDVLVVGCSSSEVLGEKIGSHSSEETARVVFDEIYKACAAKKIMLAAQCCEHLNRALIVEAETARELGLEKVNVVPFPKAGGSFATAAYHAFLAPAAVEFIRADAGMDIGDTLIGMHLKHVAVPLRLSVKKIGEANIVCARVRPKFIGGIRAHYDEALL